MEIFTVPAPAHYREKLESFARKTDNLRETMIPMSARRAGRPGVAAERDAYGQELWSCYKGVNPYEIIERDDGLVDIGSALPYFLAFENWPQHEQEAIHLARGPVLDIGCGAGRVALYLQGKRHRVQAIDNSPMAVKVSKLRGVKSARVLSIDDIRVLKQKFGSIVLYGNNFGLLGGMKKARRLLGVMHRITTPDALIIAAASDPYKTCDPVHLRYHQRNRDRARMGGQIRLRIRHCQFCGPWFDYLFASQDEVRCIVEKTGWVISDIVESMGPGFVAILKKR
jgi:SAM-dependent methyltransferase